jgi:hypothetical protein
MVLYSQLCVTVLALALLYVYFKLEFLIHMLPYISSQKSSSLRYITTVRKALSLVKETAAAFSQAVIEVAVITPLRTVVTQLNRSITLRVKYSHYTHRLINTTRANIVAESGIFDHILATLSIRAVTGAISSSVWFANITSAFEAISSQVSTLSVSFLSSTCAAAFSNFKVVFFFVAFLTLLFSLTSAILLVV